jgi:hypothetical protein
VGDGPRNLLGGNNRFFRLQPGSVTYRTVQRARPGDDQRDRDIVADLVCLLAGGDITKEETIRWTCPVDGIVPYVKFRARERLFREAVLYALGVKEEADPVRCDNVQKRVCRQQFGAALDEMCGSCPFFPPTITMPALPGETDRDTGDR